MTRRPDARTRARAWLVVAAMTTMAVFGTTPEASAQLYERICSLYGRGYYYLPGTEICLNPEQRDARMQTSGGTWRFWSPSEPIEPIGNLRAQCGGGLVKFATIDGSGLFVNDREQFESTASMQLSLEPEEYISQVIFRGGFTGVERGNFCLFYKSESPGNGTGYTPMACIDTAKHASGIVPVGFTPRLTRAPASLTPTFVVGANGYPWPVTTPAEVGGSLEAWLCIKRGIRS